MLDEVPDHRHRAFGGVGDYGVPAIGKSLELHQMRRERCRNIRLALDRVNRIVLSAEHEGRTLDAVKIREHVERVAFTAGFRKPLQHLGPADCTACHIWIARSARVERKGQSSPRIERGLVRVTLNLEESAARQGADFRAAKSLK